MADEIDTKVLQEAISTETKEQIPVPAAEPSVEESQYSESETLAMENGWVPKDQWKGDPDSWRPAKEFNDRGEFFKRIDRLEHKNKELQQAMTFLTDQQKRQYLAGFQEAIKQLRQRRDAALENGDNLQAARISDKIDEVKDQAQVAQRQAVQPAPTPIEPSETYRSWATKNSWYTQDKVLTKYAEAVGATFKEENPRSSEGEMLRHVEMEVKREFPTKFGPKGPPSPEGTGRGTGTKTGTTGKYSSVEGTLTSEQRSIMNTIIKTTGMTKDEYLRQYSGQ
jgi:hypothetical protein